MNDSITCDDCGGFFPISEKVKGDYFLPGSKEDMIAVWVCKFCSANISLFHQAETIEMIREGAIENHNKNCKNCGGNKGKDDTDPKPPLPFPRLVN
jgi:hypothetical protein